MIGVGEDAEEGDESWGSTAAASASVVAVGPAEEAEGGAGVVADGVEGGEEDGEVGGDGDEGGSKGASFEVSSVRGED